MRFVVIIGELGKSAFQPRESLSTKLNCGENHTRMQRIMVSLIFPPCQAALTVSAHLRGAVGKHSIYQSLLILPLCARRSISCMTFVVSTCVQGDFSHNESLIHILRTIRIYSSLSVVK